MPVPTVVVSDFDQTIALTFAPPPNGIGVREAYRQTIGEIFGEYAVGILDNFRTQSPREIAIAIWDDLGSVDAAVDGKRYYLRRKDALDAVMPSGLGAEIVWSGDAALDALVEVMTRRRLELMLPNIGKEMPDGTQWPRLTPRFAEVWRRITEEPMFRTAILSSGHDVFIRRTFELYGLSPPDLLITDDFLRREGIPHRKPDVELWELVLSEIRNQGFLPEVSVYIGDDRKADGGLAQRAQIPFLHFAAEGSPWHGHRGTFSDWVQAENMLLQCVGE